jgi:PAS domain S-box-containing protein
MKEKISERNIQFLEGGGEMGELIRNKNWSATPLGAPENWPQSLKTSLSILLNSKFPMFLWWGKDLICFYNDAYRPSLGLEGKHPFILGMNAKDAWTEIWPIIKPLIDQVLAGGEATWSEDQLIPIFRNGKIEDVYWTFSYSPVKDEEGKVAGVMVICSETTQKVLNLKSLEESNQRYIKNILQAPAAMCILTGKDFVVEIANQRVLDLWSKTSKEVIGIPVLEALPEIKDQGIGELLNKVYSTGEKFTANEFPVMLLRNGKMETLFLNFVYEAIRDSEGNISGIMVIAMDVTLQAIARKKIEESEKRFRNVADTAPVLIWMSDTQKLCNYFNKAWLNYTGRSMEEEFGNGWLEGVHADDLQKCLYAYVTAFEKQEKFYLEFRLRRYDGKYRWISNYAVPRISLDGTFEGYIGACMDIDERVLYQERLKESEEKLSIVIEASELGTWELNLITREIKYSDRYLEILGYPNRIKLTHAELLQHLHPDDQKIRENAFREAFLTGVLHYETRIIRKDQTLHWIEAKGKVFYDKQKRPSYVVGTVRDITDEKLFQQRLQQREHKFRLLADSMPQHVWTSDPAGNLNYFNRSVYDYTGLSASSLLEKKWLEIVHPLDLEATQKAWDKAIKTGEHFLFEHRFLRHDGEYRWQLSRALPQHDESGNIQMWVGISTDIQEQKAFASELEKQVLQRTRELKKKNMDLEKMNKELQSFAYISSHDLQEPLRKIQTFATRILEKEKHTLSENGLTYFAGMQRAAHRMQILIQDLLAYSKTNDTERVFKKTDLNEIITEVKADFKETLAMKNGTIELEEVCEANVIPFQIRQLFHNLLSNSIKFASKERPLHIKVRCELVKGEKLNLVVPFPEKIYCHISISDNGIGFDPQYRERIFEVFQRLHGKEEYTGTGIGLAIVKKIVDNHNGIITATGGINEGATFNIYFPV